MNLNYLLYVFVVNSFSKFNFFLFNFNILFSWILSIDKVTVEFFTGGGKRNPGGPNLTGSPGACPPSRKF